MTNRTKNVLKRVIGAKQSSFVPDYHITDNVSIYQEVLHSMKTKQGMMGFMILKIDLEKAYGHFSWSFIHDTHKSWF